MTGERAALLVVCWSVAYVLCHDVVLVSRFCSCSSSDVLFLRLA